jgi:hypothetical protein
LPRRRRGGVANARQGARLRNSSVGDELCRLATEEFSKAENNDEAQIPYAFDRTRVNAAVNAASAASLATPVTPWSTPPKRRFNNKRSNDSFRNNGGDHSKNNNNSNSNSNNNKRRSNEGGGGGKKQKRGDG